MSFAELNQLKNKLVSVYLFNWMKNSIICSNYFYRRLFYQLYL